LSRGRLAALSLILPDDQDLKDAFRSLVRDSLFAAVVDPIVALGRE
jgi:hypothetical protein